VSDRNWVRPLGALVPEEPIGPAQPGSRPSNGNISRLSLPISTAQLRTLAIRRQPMMKCQLHSTFGKSLSVTADLHPQRPHKTDPTIAINWLVPTVNPLERWLLWLRLTCKPRSSISAKDQRINDTLVRGSRLILESMRIRRC
jgi:hypothetical protein